MLWEASGAPRQVMGCVCEKHAAFRDERQEEQRRRRVEEEGEGGKEEGIWGWGQLEVKLLGAVQNSHLHNGQEKRERVW